MKEINFKYINKYKIQIIIIFFIIIISRLLWLYYNFNIKYKDLKENEKISVMVIKNESISSSKISYLVKYDNNKFILNIYKDVQNNKEDVINKYGNFQYGDILELRSKIIIPQKLNNPYEFDYKKYLNSNNIIGTISVYSLKKIGNNSTNVILKLSYFLREDIGKRIDNYLPNKEAGLFKSMIYGDDRSLDEKIKNDFSKDGILHLIAVSGSHMAILIVITSVLEKVFNKNISNFINIFLIVIFCIISGLQPSTLRAGITAIIIIFCKNYNIKTSSYIKIFISFCVIFLYNPYVIFNIGCTMSYLATISIIIFYSQVFSFIDILLIKIFKVKYQINCYNNVCNTKKIKIIIYNMFKAINKVLSLTLSASILIIPIQLIYFNSFEITSIIANIVITTITTIETFIGFVTILFIYIPIVSDILINSNYVILKLIIFFTSFLSNLNLPSIKFPSLNFISLILFYFCILVNNFNKYIIFKLTKYSSKKIKRIIKILNLFMFIYICFLYLYITKIEEYVYFFNVEQGNMCFMHKNGKNILVDSGSTRDKLAYNILNNFLRSRCIDKIDIVIITHMHTDHINAIEDICNNFKVESVIYSLPKSESSEYEKLIKYIEKKNINKIIVNSNDNINFGKINIYVLSPPKDGKIQSLDEVNANSLALIINSKNENYLFMGDATKETEKYILDNVNHIEDNEKKSKILNILKNIKIWQVGHHGSKTSTSEYFLNNISAKNAVISSKRKVYGHPAKETIDLLKRYNIKFYITEYKGALKF